MQRINCIRNKRLIVRAHKDTNVSVFQRSPSNGNIGLHEAQHAFEICSRLPEHKQDDCYAVFGVDKEKTVKYLNIVKTLNKTYKLQDELSAKQYNTPMILLTYRYVVLVIEIIISMMFE